MKELVLSSASERSSIRRFYRSTALVSVLTLCSKVLGLVRDMVLAAAFFGAWLDSFILAFTIPNLFRRIFGEGALSAAFVPVYVDKKRTAGNASAGRFARGVVTRLFIYLGVGAAAISLLCLLATVFNLPLKAEHTLRLTAIMAPYAVLICTSALLGGALNSHGKFALSAASPILLNLLLVAAAFFYLRSGSETAVYALAVAVLIGGTLQLLLLFASHTAVTRRAEPQETLDTGKENDADALKRVGQAFWPVALAAGLFQVNVLVDRLFAEWLVPHDGAVSSLFLGGRIMQFPLALFAAAVATTMLPALSEKASKKDYGRFSRDTMRNLRTLLFLLIPSAVGLSIIGRGVVTLLFERGSFVATPGSLDRTTLVIVLSAPGLVGYGGASVLARVFYALGDTSTPSRCAVATVALNVVLNVLLVLVFNRAPFDAGEAGLALASSISGCVYFALLLGFLWRNEQFRKAVRVERKKKGRSVAGAIRMPDTRWMVSRVTCAAAAAGIAGILLYWKFLEAALNLIGRKPAEEIYLPLAVLLSFAFFFFVFFYLLKRLTGDGRLAELTSSFLRTAGISAGMGVITYWVYMSLPPDGESFVVPLQRVLCPVVLGAGVYWFLSGFVSAREYREAVTTIRGKETAKKKPK